MYSAEIYVPRVSGHHTVAAFQRKLGGALMLRCVAVSDSINGNSFGFNVSYPLQ
jgi:hypothetical protein